MTIPSHRHYRTLLTLLRGSVVPKDVAVLDWTGLVEIPPNQMPIASGGFGDVYLGKWVHPDAGQWTLDAEVDGELEHFELPDVVVKVARLVSYGNENMKRKRRILFQRELEVWQRLDHPNVVPLVGFTLEHAEALPSMVLLLMHNGPIKQYLLLNPDVPRIPLVIGIAEGLEYLHNFEPTITHGDLKADNVLVDSYGAARLCDFGLSRMTEDRTLWATTTTAVKGTVRWMAPEMFQEDARTATRESDIWALGMTMLEILTGKPPFYTYHNDMGVILAVTGRFETPKIPEDVEVPLWLLNLWMLCWNFEPDGRPRSEEVVAMIRAGMASEGMQTDGMNVIGHGMGHWTDATSPSSSTASSTPNLTPTIPITQSAVRLWDSVLCQEVTPFRAPPISDVVCCVSFSRSGAYIATGDYYAPNYVRIWSLETGKEVGRLEGHTGTVEFVGWKPKLGINAECEGADETVLSCGGDKTVRAWSLAQLGNPSKPERLEADEAPTSESTEVQTLSQTLWIHELQSWSWELEFSPSGNHVAIIDEEVAGKILDVSNGLELARFEYSEGMRLFSVAYSGDGRVVASGYKAGQICIWDASAIPATEHSNRESSTPPSYQLPLLQVLVPPQFHAGDRGVYGLEISPCNKILAAACGDEVIRLWSHSSSPSFCTLQELHGHTGVVNSVAFTADSKYLLSGSWDTTFRKWDVQSARGVMVKKCRARVFSVAVSPDGRYFLAGGG